MIKQENQSMEKLLALTSTEQADSQKKEGS
jgi:hypothetical protein